MPHPIPLSRVSRIGVIEQRMMMASGPAQKLALLREFIAEIHRDDPAYALGLAAEGYRLAATLRDAGTEADILRYRGLCYLALGRYEAAIEDLAIAFERSFDLAKYADAAAAALAIGRASRELAKLEEALAWYGRALDICIRGGLPAERAEVLEAMGDLRTGLGDYPKALEHYLECLALREGLNDIHGAGLALSAIGIVYGLIRDYDAAFEYFTRSLDAFRESEDRYREVKALTNLGSIYYTRGKLEKALDHELRAMAIYETLGDRANLGHTLTMIGAIHEKAGTASAAMEFYMRAYALLDQNTDDEPRVALLLNIGRLYVTLGATGDALFIFDQAVRIAEAINDLHMQYQVHRAIADLHEQAGQLRPALEHFKQYAEIRERVSGEEKQRSIAELQVRFDLDKAEREREIYRLKAQQLETEMRLKHNELTAMALNLLQKKELLNEMKLQLEHLREGGGDSAGMQATPLLREAESAHSDDDWKRFEQQLDNLHQDFIHTLSARCPTLTPSELKICSLTRLDLATKDIANILYTSIRTIQTHKYNIRKKLGLAPNINLVTYLASLS